MSGTRRTEVSDRESPGFPLAAWDHFTQSLLPQHQFRVVRYDPSGHENSDAPSDPSQTLFTSLADDVARQLVVPFAVDKGRHMDWRQALRLARRETILTVAAGTYIFVLEKPDVMDQIWRTRALMHAQLTPVSMTRHSPRTVSGARTGHNIECMVLALGDRESEIVRQCELDFAEMLTIEQRKGRGKGGHMGPNPNDMTVANTKEAAQVLLLDAQEALLKVVVDITSPSFVSWREHYARRCPECLNWF
ncbi:alpha/beta-hydrolase [Xylaria nigripes]|nr:alpha/beta-hydrolase [Xylaria nigripes]